MTITTDKQKHLEYENNRIQAERRLRFIKETDPLEHDVIEGTLTVEELKAAKDKIREGLPYKTLDDL